MFKIRFIGEGHVETTAPAHDQHVCVWSNSKYLVLPGFEWLSPTCCLRAAFASPSAWLARSKLPSLPLTWIPRSGIHNRLAFLRNSTISWTSLRDSHSSHRAYHGRASSLLMPPWRMITICSGHPLKTRKRQIPSDLPCSTTGAAISAACHPRWHQLRPCSFESDHCAPSIFQPSMRHALVAVTIPEQQQTPSFYRKAKIRKYDQLTYHPKNALLYEWSQHESSVDDRGLSALIRRSPIAITWCNHHAIHVVPFNSHLSYDDLLSRKPDGLFREAATYSRAISTEPYRIASPEAAVYPNAT